MKLHEGSKIALFVSLAVTAVLLAGCLVCDSRVHYTGVQNETLKQVRCGETTKDWLVATLGEPAEQTLTDEGTEILRYRCRKKEDSEVVLFPIIIVDNQEITEHTVAFEIKDGIVQRYWKES